MSWIESHQELASHPKTRRLRRLLGCSLPETIGYLHMLWWWTLDYADDGDLSAYEPADIADGCCWEGDPVTFWNCLLSAGFIDDDSRVHDWHDYAGRLVVKREANRSRAHAAYTKKRDSLRADYAQTTRRDGADCEQSTGSLQGYPTNPTLPHPTVESSNELSCVHSSSKGAVENAAFDAFWDAYPRKIAKDVARRAWSARLKGKDSPDDMTTAARHYSEWVSESETEARFIKHAATFIGPDRPYRDWVDGIPEAVRGNGKADIWAGVGAIPDEWKADDDQG